MHHSHFTSTFFSCPFFLKNACKNNCRWQYGKELLTLFGNEIKSIISIIGCGFV